MKPLDGEDRRAASPNVVASALPNSGPIAKACVECIRSGDDHPGVSPGAIERNHRLFETKQ